MSYKLQTAGQITFGCAELQQAIIVQDLRPPASTEQPILRLGVAGFAPDQARAIERALQRPAGLPKWRIGRFGEADAWMVNGSKLRMMQGGILKVSPASPAEQSVRLDPSDIDRPVAFATPMACLDVEPRCTFNVQSLGSMHGTLLQFENWLHQVCTLFVVGRDVVRLGPQLRHGVFHIRYRSALVAVLDFRKGRAGVSPHAHPAEFAQASWEKMPISAGDVPASFIQTSPAELAWNYARRSENELLPARYFEQPIFFRSAPKIPPRWVSDSHLLLLRELAAEPSTFAALQQCTGLSTAQMRQDLTCLYFGGAITTTRAKAAKPTLRAGGPGPQSSRASVEPLSEDSSRPRFTPDSTAPASLEYRRFAAGTTT